MVKKISILVNDSECSCQLEYSEGMERVEILTHLLGATVLQGRKLNLQQKDMLVLLRKAWKFYEQE